MLKIFANDVKEWGWRTAFYNARFLLACRVLPGSHYHISIRGADESCEICENE